jgi:hypothetical protein
MAREYSFGGDAKAKRDRYQTLAATLFSERKSGFDPHWSELDEYLLPRRTRFWTGDKNRGDKRNQKIINSTGRFAARTLASGLHAGLTSPARPWMKLTTPDPDLAKFAPVKAWLHDVTQRMLVVFAQTNLYNSFPITYGDIGVFGTAAVALLDDSKDLFRCYNYALGSYAIGLNARGMVSSFVREFELTVRQVVEEFGLKENGRDIDWSNISTIVKTAWDRGEYQTPVKVTWMITPNQEADPSKLLPKFYLFASCWWETGSTEKNFLRESGFRTFPLMCPRWDVTEGDSYGTDCPGMTALGDVKQLQIMEKKKAQAIAKMVDPPLTGPTALMTQKTSLLSGDITYVDDQNKTLRSIHDVNLRVDHLAQDIQNVEYRVQRAFYEDLFLMLARSDPQAGSQRPTAREVEERHEEKLIALGPVLERTNDELLDPIVDRVFEMMDRAGLIPPAPEQLQGVNLKVEYISILAQAQKLVGVVGLDRFMQNVLTIAPVIPGILYKVDTNRVADVYGDLLGIDPNIVRSDEDADGLAAEAAKAQQAQMEAENAAKMSVAVKNAGTTPMEGDTALSRMTQGAAQEQVA